MSQVFTGLTTVLSGSYRRHLHRLMWLKAQLEAQQICVLSPVGTGSTNPGATFVLLDADPVNDHQLLQDAVFAKLRTCSFQVLANFDGYLGSASILEVGYGIALGLQIYAVEKVTDPNLEPYCRMLSDVFPNLFSSAPWLPGRKEKESWLETL